MMFTAIKPPQPAGASTQVPAAPAAKPRDPEDARLKEACQELEGVFWQLLLRSMRRTLPGDGILGDSSTAQLYQDMLDGEYAQLLARQDESGLGELLYRQLSRQASTPPAGSKPAS